MTRPNSSKVIENPNLLCKVDHSKDVRGILIHCLNVGSLMSHLDEVELWLDEQKPHILGLNETRLDNSVTDENIDIEGYSVLRKIVIGSVEDVQSILIITLLLSVEKILMMI